MIEHDSIFFDLKVSSQTDNDFVNFYNQLESNNFPKQRVKSFYYFQIGRWDLQLLNDQIIKFPANKIENAIQQSVELLAREDFRNYKK